MNIIWFFSTTLTWTCQNTKEASMPTLKILGFKKLSWKKKMLYTKNLRRVSDQFLPVSQDVQVEKRCLI